MTAIARLMTRYHGRHVVIVATRHLRCYRIHLTHPFPSMRVSLPSCASRVSRHDDDVNAMLCALCWRCRCVMSCRASSHPHPSHHRLAQLPSDVGPRDDGDSDVTLWSLGMPWWARVQYGSAPGHPQVQLCSSPPPPSSESLAATVVSCNTMVHCTSSRSCNTSCKIIEVVLQV